MTHDWAAAIEFVEEADDALIEAITAGETDRVRYAAPDRIADTVRYPAAESCLYLADAPVSAHGRLELLWYFEEQSISDNYHRYGNLGARSQEDRAECL